MRSVELLLAEYHIFLHFITSPKDEESTAIKSAFTGAASLEAAPCYFDGELTILSQGTVS